MKWITLIVTLYSNYLHAQPPRLVLPIGHTNSINSFCFSHNGKYILTGSDDKTVKLWDANTGRLLRDFTYHSNAVATVNFNPDNQTIISGSADGSLLECDIFTGNITNIITREADRITASSISHDGKFIAFADGDYSISIWDTKTKRIIKKINAHKEKINILLFANTSNKLLSSSYDNKVKIWDITSGNKINEISKPTSEDILIESVTFSPDDKNILICCKKYTLELYDASTCKLIKKAANDTLKYSNASYSNNGKHIAAGGPAGKFYILDAATWKLIIAGENTEEPFINTNMIRFGNDDRKILTISGISGKAKMWNVEDGSLVYRLQGNSTDVFNARFSPGGSLVVTSCGGDNTAKIWDITTGRLLISYRGHKSLVKAATLSPDAGQLATTSWDQTAKVWDIFTGKPVKEIKLPYDGDYTVQFSLDGKKLLTTVLYDSIAYVWDIGTGKKLFELRGHSDDLIFATYSPNGKYIATASRDNTVKLWNANDGSFIKTFSGHEHWVTSVNFSSDNLSIVSSSFDSTAKTWSVASGKCIESFKGHSGGLTFASFNNNSSRIVTASEDKTAKIWDITGTCIYTLQGHNDIVTSATYNRDGNLILTSSNDNTCKIWNAKSGTNRVSFFALGTSDYMTQAEDGYYRCSPNAAKLLHYVRKDLQVISFDQLDMKYNRPDKIFETLENTDTAMKSAYRKAYFKRIKKAGIDSATFSSEYSAPVSEISNISSITNEQKTNLLTLKIRAADKNTRLSRFNIWVNESPLFGMKGIQLASRMSNFFDTTVTIKLSAGKNSIETSVHNVNGAESYRTPLVITHKADVNPKIHFIGIGINQFRKTEYNLSWSVKDIHDLLNKFKEKYSTQLIVDTLFDENVTTRNILAIKDNLKTLGVNDKVILAYSGHGLLGKEYDYFLSTYNVDFNNPEQNGLPYDELENLFDGIAPRMKLMLIDACHSGEVDKEEMELAEKIKSTLNTEGVKGLSLGIRPKKKLGSENSFEIMQTYFANVSRTTGTTVISAAAGTQYALEKGELKNGVFTYSILEAMNKNKALTVQSLKRIVISRVVQLTHGLQKPTSRTEVNTFDWNIW